MIANPRVTVSEFLSVPDASPYHELMDGEILQRPFADAPHSALVVELIYLLMLNVGSSGAVRILPSLRYLDARHDWVLLPDISIIDSGLLRDISNKADPVEVMPGLAIEVLSADDRAGLVLRKIVRYMSADIPLWIVDPESETITIWMPGTDGVIANPDVPLTAAPVLPGFELDVPALFAVLHAE